MDMLEPGVRRMHEGLLLEQNEGWLDRHGQILEEVEKSLEILVSTKEEFPEESIEVLKDVDQRIQKLIGLLSAMQTDISSSLLNSYRLFINPYPLTKFGIQESNRQIHQIYTDKYGKVLVYEPYKKKEEGSTFGTIFVKKDSSKQWIGKIGESRSLIQKHETTLEEINIDAIFEKLATDFYWEFGRGFFKLPKTRLSEQPLVNQFGPDKPRWPLLDCMYTFIEKNKDKTCLRVMSKFIEKYHNFKDARTCDRDGEISFIEFIKKWHCPPENLLTPEKIIVPLAGFMEMIAVGRVLADTDLLGGSLDNAGFVWEVGDSGTIIGAHTVKIDPGRAFNFSCKEEDTTPSTLNWVWNTKKNLNGPQLTDLKNIQTAQNNKSLVLYWDKLTPKQQDLFLCTLFNSSRYTQAPDILDYLFYREGGFCQNGQDLLPKKIAQKFQIDMLKWFHLQMEIYHDDLRKFHQKYPQQALRAHYIDTCGMLAVPMKEESFPIRNLFTEIVVIDGKKKKMDELGTESKYALDPYLDEKDSIKETVNRLELLSQAIPIETLFENNRRVLLVGRAGIGKTTLCQKIAHDWASGKLWNDTFDVVYWFSLRDLNEIKCDDDPYIFFSKQAIPHVFEKLPTVEFLANQISRQTKKVLLILDGYDEASDPLAKAVEKLLQETHFHILLAFRPGKVNALEVDGIVENIGFSDAQIQTYIDKFSKRRDENLSQQQKGKGLFTLIKENPNLYSIAHVPLQLQMIVSLYDESGNVPQASSLTKLYQYMISQLYDWQFRNKQQENKNHQLLCLGEIAHIGLECGKLIISPEINQLSFKDSMDSLLETGLLKKIKGEKVGYYFIHLTFQEYLAAFYISQKTSGERKTFIKDKRHISRYQLVLAFLAGLIPPEKIQKFFLSLCSEDVLLPRPYLLELSLRCLNECERFEKDSQPIVEKFISQDLKVLDESLSNGYSPIFLAISQGQNHALKWLGTHYDFLLQRKDKEGNTVCMFCVKKGNLELLSWLHQKNSSLILEQREDGKTALHEAAYGECDDVIDFLLQNGGSTLTSKYRTNGLTALHYAAAKGYEYALKRLLEVDGQLISKYKWDGWTPFHEAAAEGHKNALEILLEADSRIITQFTDDNWTPLHAAAARGHIEIGRWLYNKANILLNIVDQAGNTPLMIAEREDQKAFAEWIESVGGQRRTCSIM